MIKEIESNIYYKLITDLIAENKSEAKIQRIKLNLNIIDFKTFFDVCKRHDVASIIYPYLKLYFHEPLPEDWVKEYLSVKLQISFMLEITKDIATSLAKKNINFVVLKNGGIALQLMDDPALCPMGDIDTLVSKEEFKAAHEVILESGFKFKFRSEFEEEDVEKAFFDGGTEYVYTNEHGQSMWLELSHRAISGRWIRLDKEPKTNELLKNSTLLPNSSVRVLSPEDNLLQVSIHTAKHSYVREPGFRLHQDVDRIVSRLNINWNIFIAKVNEVGCNTAVYFSLFFAHQIFDTPIPTVVLKTLQPSKLKEKFIRNIVYKVGIMEPLQKKFSRPLFILFQLALYDSISDIFKVMYPSTVWLKKKYDFKSSLLIPFYMTVRILDLIGYRKQK